MRDSGAKLLDERMQEEGGKPPIAQSAGASGASIDAAKMIGKSVSRIDGPKKVTGGAMYAADHPIENLAYGVGVPSTIGNGKILSVDTSAAEKMPGVLAVLHHGNFGKLYRPAQGFEQNSHASETRPPFADDVIYYNGQFVAMVVAHTFQQAQAAAAKVKVSYEEHSPLVLLGDTPVLDQPPARNYSRGDADAAYASAPVKIDATYNIPVETHNPMEMHATIAKWEGQKLTLYETTQGVVNHHNTIAQILDHPLEQIQVISPFVGSGFGDKLFPWPQSAMAAVAARKVGRPVKITVPRNLMFTTVGHRPRSRQRVRLSATAEGKLLSIHHDVQQITSMVDDYIENCTEPTPYLYSAPNVTTVQNLVHANLGTPCPMRGPGTTPGVYALDSALDELAAKLNLDPMQVRLTNYAEMDESAKVPFSSKHLRECYEQAAQRFGWSKRNPKVGSMRAGNEILGWGMSTATWPAGRGEAEVRVTLLANGTARAVSASQDIGTGTYTLLAQAIADKTGLPFSKIEVKLGDSSLPPGPMSGGSQATSSIMPAVAKAADQAVQTLMKVAVKTDKSPFQNADPESLVMSEGRVHKKDEPASSGVPLGEIMALRQISSLDGKAKTGPDAEMKKKYSFHSFGAHFVEVSYDPQIVRLRVTRWVTVIDGGQMINLKTARNQIAGAIVMGMGMGLFEETVYDTRTAHPLNDNYSDYLISTNPDVPELDVSFLNYPDLKLNEYGARGVGEIGLTGCASALTSAVYHATGVRVRDLPIRIEQLLAEQREGRV